MGKKWRKPFSPNTKKIRPSRIRAINATIFIHFPFNTAKNFSRNAAGCAYSPPALYKLAGCHDRFNETWSNQINSRPPKNSGPHQGIGKLIEGFVPAGTVISPHRTGWDFESSIDVRNLFPMLAAP